MVQWMYRILSNGNSSDVCLQLRYVVVDRCLVFFTIGTAGPLFALIRTVRFHYQMTQSGPDRRLVIHLFPAVASFLLQNPVVCTKCADACKRYKSRSSTDCRSCA